MNLFDIELIKSDRDNLHCNPRFKAAMVRINQAKAAREWNAQRQQRDKAGNSMALARLIQAQLSGVVSDILVNGLKEWISEPKSKPHPLDAKIAAVVCNR